ncbi:MAG: hypothetical protein U0894_03855 [Pirellulales bacterium]
MAEGFGVWLLIPGVMCTPSQGIASVVAQDGALQTGRSGERLPKPCGILAKYVSTPDASYGWKERRTAKWWDLAGMSK